jgi:hypothetical protein
LCQRSRRDTLIRNQQVIGSSPIVGSIDSAASLLHTTSTDSSISFPCSCIQFGTALSTVFFLYRLRWSGARPHNRLRS